MKELILAAPYLLQMNTESGIPAAIGGPGAKWAQLLKSKGGPVSVILGYADAAPSRGDVGEEVVEKMGAKIAAGLKADDWGREWLTGNGDHPGKNTWNAVGMDSRGFWWIEPRTKLRRMLHGWDIFYKANYAIVGP